MVRGDHSFHANCFKIFSSLKCFCNAAVVSTALCDFKITVYKLHAEQIVQRMTHKTTHLQWSTYSDHCMTYLCVFMCAGMPVCVCVCVCVCVRVHVCVRACTSVLEVIEKEDIG